MRRLSRQRTRAASSVAGKASRRSASMRATSASSQSLSCWPRATSREVGPWGLGGGGGGAGGWVGSGVVEQAGRCVQVDGLERAHEGPAQAQAVLEQLVQVLHRGIAAGVEV